jgi:hypothetical protein
MGMSLTFTNRFMERFGAEGEAKVTAVFFKYFKVLSDEAIKVTYTRSSKMMGIADFRNRTVRLAALDGHTIAHEFTHMVQHLKHTIPQGEQACDIFTCALSSEVCDSNLYVRTHNAPKDVIHMICMKAIELRAGGLRNYIAYTKESLKNWKDFKQTTE